MDVVPEGQVDVLSAGVRLPLQHAAQRVRPSRPRAAGYTLLRRLRLGVVSVSCQKLANGDCEDANANERGKDERQQSIHADS